MTLRELQYERERRRAKSQADWSAIVTMLTEMTLLGTAKWSRVEGKDIQAHIVGMDGYFTLCECHGLARMNRHGGLVFRNLLHQLEDLDLLLMAISKQFGYDLDAGDAARSDMVNELTRLHMKTVSKMTGDDFDYGRLDELRQEWETVKDAIREFWNPDRPRKQEDDGPTGGKL